VGLSLLQYRWASAEGGVVDPGGTWAIFEAQFPTVPADQVWQVERLVVFAPAGYEQGLAGTTPKLVELPQGTTLEIYAYVEDPSAQTVPVDAGFLEPHPIGPLGIPGYIAVSDASPLTVLGGQTLTISVPVAPAVPSPGGGGYYWIGGVRARALVASYQGTPGAPQPLGAAVPAPGGPS
jgi:hypothetical protein